MSVTVDVQGLQSAMHGERGIARYVLETSQGVEEVAGDLVGHYLLNPDLSVPLAVEPLLATGKLRVDREAPPGAGVFHMTSPFEGVPLTRLWPAWARSPEVSLIATLYDVIPELYPDSYLATRAAAQAYGERRALVQTADLVLAISESTGRDAVSVLGIDEDKVRVVHAGVSPFFRPAPDRGDAYTVARLALPRLEREFYLYTGGMDFRKNVDGLLAAYSRLPSGLRARRQLVVVCKLQPSEQAHYDVICRSLGIHGAVLFTGYVTDETLRHLYQSAHVFLFPSLYEGFGLPVLEAMACGTAVLAGRNSSLVEIVRDDACLFDSSSTESITSTLERFEEHPARAEALRSGQVPEEYTWRGVSERIASAYEEELRRATRRHGQRRRRVAMVAPLPPVRSGVAMYTQRLISALERYVDVDVVPDGVVGAETSASAYESATDRRRNADAIVYCLGNSEHHLQALNGLMHRPGAVLLHDVRLDGLWSAAQHMVDPLLRDRARHIVGTRTNAPQSRAAYTQRLDTTEVEPVVRRADVVLVHSSFASHVVRLATPPDLHDKVRLVTLGTPRAATSSQQLPPCSGKTVVSLGLVHPRKQSEKVLAAFLSCAATRPDDRFVLVGPVDSAFGQQLELSLYKTGLGNVMLVTDADDETYSAWLQAADVAVQLRGVTNGESSAALMDCFAYGVATVVTEIGAVRDVPSNIATRVPVDITSEELTSTVLGLLDDEVERARLSRVARRYAEDHSFDRAAVELLRAVLSSEDLELVFL